MASPMSSPLTLGAITTGAAARGAALATGFGTAAGAAVAVAGLGAATGAAAAGGGTEPPVGPPGGSVGSLIVGAAEGLGGRLILTVSFFG